MKRPFSRILNVTTAFSLVEVVLALAIVAIGMITILGLFPQGLTSARNASDDSLCAMIAQDTVAARRIDIQNGDPIGNPNILPRWFTADGKETNDLSASIAMYKCEITASSLGIPNLESTQVRIVWPWYAASTATKSPPNTNIFVTEIALY